MPPLWQFSILNVSPRNTFQGNGLPGRIPACLLRCEPAAATNSSPFARLDNSYPAESDESEKRVADRQLVTGPDTP